MINYALPTKCVNRLQDTADTTSSRLVNISGRQRMLLQHMAKFYAYKIWGFKQTEIVDKTGRTKNEFRAVLNDLIATPENTKELNSKLKQAKLQWDLYRHRLERKGKEIPLIMEITNEKMLS